MWHGHTRSCIQFNYQWLLFWDRRSCSEHDDFNMMTWIIITALYLLTWLWGLLKKMLGYSFKSIKSIHIRLQNMLVISLFHSDLPCSRVPTVVKFSCTWKNAQSVLRVKTFWLVHTESYLQPTNIFSMKVLQFFLCHPANKLVCKQQSEGTRRTSLPTKNPDFFNCGLKWKSQNKELKSRKSTSLKHISLVSKLKRAKSAVCEC